MADECSEGRQTSAHNGDLGFKYRPVHKRVKSKGLIGAGTVVPEDNGSDDGDDPETI